MRCWHCGSQVIWGGDHSFEDYCCEGDGIVTNMQCSGCPAHYEIYLPFEEEDNSLN